MKIAGTTIHKQEIKALLFAFSYFFLLMSSYYILRPIRDEMAITGGIKNIPWLFTATFLATLCLAPVVAWLLSRYTRKQFLPAIFYLFILSLLIFFIAINSNPKNPYTARLFYIWVSVYILFAVSISWSFMLDIFYTEQAKRLFGFIAAGASTGALVGPSIVILLVKPLGISYLLLIAALLLQLLLLCVRSLIKWQTHENTKANQDIPKNFDSKLSPNLFSALLLIRKSPYLIAICLFLFLLTLMATFLYFQQAYIVKQTFIEQEDRTNFFANLELLTNLSALIGQLLITSNLIRWIKLSGTLMIMPFIISISFSVLAIAPVLLVLAVVQVIRRAGNYAILRPAREILFSKLSSEEKYKVKNFIDTVVYRGGDAISGWVYAALIALGFTLAGTALIAAPIALIWALLGYRLGRYHEAKQT